MVFTLVQCEEALGLQSWVALAFFYLATLRPGSGPPKQAASKQQASAAMYLLLSKVAVLLLSVACERASTA